MGSRSERARTVFGAIIHEIRVERVTFMAGSIAYNAFVSLLPLLFLLLALVSAIGNQRLEASLIAVVRATVTPGAGEVLVTELRNASTEASALGLAVLIWGMLRIFRSLDAAFSDIYETETRNSLADQLADGLVVFVSMAAVILVAALVESRVTLGGGSTLPWLGQRLVLVGFISAALFPMYYLFPDEPTMHPTETIPGVLFTAVSLVALESVFQLYIRYSANTAENGVLASILVFMTWLYVSGLVVLVGAAINAVCSNRSQDVDIQPVIGGVPKSTRDGHTASLPQDVVADLQQRLSTASELTVVVDDRSISLPVPEQATVEIDTATLPFLSGTIGLRLEWPDDERE